MNRPAAPSAPADSAALRLQRRWYADRPAPLALRPLAWLYRALTALRRTCYRRGWLRVQRLPVPVLVIGNLTAGGAGKTPATLAIARWLQGQGWRPGVMSRGYGRRDQANRLVHAGDAPGDVGDEPLLYAAAGIPAAVARRRADAGRLLLQAGCDILLADDGLQHYALARDIEVLVVDGVRRFGNGALLPAGPLREPPARAQCCDLVLVNGGSARPGEHPMQLALQPAVSLRDPSRRRPLHDFTLPVHAVAGIGDPARFFAALRSQGLEVLEHPFPDHHPYNAHDLAFTPAAPVLMTSKDAVKCRPFAADSWYEVPVETVLPTEFFTALERLLRPAAARWPRPAPEQGRER